MNRNKILTFVSFLLVSVLLSTMVAAGGGSTEDGLGGGLTMANSSSAFAEAFYAEETDLLARAQIRSLLYIANETAEEMNTYVSANVVASDLTRVDRYPPIKSLATAWVGEQQVSFESWIAE